jgi:hypothetical protein
VGLVRCQLGVILRSSSTWAASAALFAARAVMPVTAQPEALCLFSINGLGGQEFRRCPITKDHMSCGSRFPRPRTRLFPILVVRRTLKLADALVRQAAIL